MPRSVNSSSQWMARPKIVLLALTVIVAVSVSLTAVLIALVIRHRSLPIVGAETASSVEHKLQEAQVASAEPRLVSLTEGEVNSVLHGRLKNSGRLASPGADGLRDLRIRLIGDQIKAFVVLAHRGTEVTVELEGKLYSEDRYLKFEPTSGSIGALRLPKTILANAMQDALSRESSKLRLPPNVADLRVENDRVLLRYD
jgi:hypothetical protein